MTPIKKQTLYSIYMGETFYVFYYSADRNWGRRMARDLIRVIRKYKMDSWSGGPIILKSVDNVRNIPQIINALPALVKVRPNPLLGGYKLIGPAFDSEDLEYQLRHMIENKPQSQFKQKYLALINKKKDHKAGLDTQGEIDTQEPGEHVDPEEFRQYGEKTIERMFRGGMFTTNKNTAARNLAPIPSSSELKSAR